jgi:uncharacterized LabA/DUF88 family protein
MRGGLAFAGTHMFNVAVLIDGGFLRALTTQAKKVYSTDLIELLAHSCVMSDERLYRALYYDCAEFSGEAKLPVSGLMHSFTGTDTLLRDLASRDFFAVRQGTLKFRGWKPRSQRVSGVPVTDADFKPDFEQKGVDMRIGLDIATLCHSKAVQRIILVTGDTDFIPAMKHARIAGLQIVLAAPPGRKPAPELLWHADIHRQVTWPSPT